MKQEKGFTLIELMIAAAIVAILTSLALPTYRDYVVRAQASEGLYVASGARAAIWEYSANHGHLPTDNPSAGLPAKESIQGTYVAEVEVVADGIQVTFGNKANLAIQGVTLVVAPTLSSQSGTVSWTCRGGTLESKYRPTVCR